MCARLAREGFLVLAPFRVASDPETASTLNIKALALGETIEGIELAQLVQPQPLAQILAELRGRPLWGQGPAW